MTISPFLRSTVEFDASQVDSENNRITGVKIMQKGELRNDRRPWFIDDQSIEQVVKIGSKPKLGLKANFGHPSDSDSSPSRFLGRWKNFRQEGDAAVADLHFSKAARSGPKGDLQQFVSDLADEAADTIGVSIHPRLTKTFMRDTMKAMARDEKIPFRMRDLASADLVDDPASTEGMFSNVADIKEWLESEGFTAEDLKDIDDEGDPDSINDEEGDMSSTQLDEIKELLQRQSDDLTKKIEDQATKLDELSTDLAAERKKNEELAAEQDRVKKIQELGSMLSIESETIAEWVRKDLSVDEVRKRILDDQIESQRGMSSDGGTGDDGTKKDPDQKFKDEYRERVSRGLGMVNLTEEEYVQSRRVDEGLEPLLATNGLAEPPARPENN